MDGNKEVIKDAFRLYKKYYLRVVLLEIFSKNEPLDNDGIKERLLSDVRKTVEMYESIQVSEVLPEFEYLAKIGCFIAVENETKMTLSGVGMKALQECVWENLANSAFFGYKGLYISDKALETSKKALCVSNRTLVVAAIAALIAILALLLQIIKCT